MSRYGLHQGLGQVSIPEKNPRLCVPTNVLEFDFAKGEAGVHEAQKPVSLLEYLIALTTTEGQLVLDPFMGSGSTGIACINFGRGFVGIEKGRDHFAAHLFWPSNRLLTWQHICSAS